MNHCENCNIRVNKDQCPVCYSILNKVNLNVFLIEKKEYKKETAKKQYYTRHGQGFFSLTYHPIIN